MSWLALAVLGGVVGLDAVSVGQVMISRPLISGTLAGLLLGRPLEGALIGATLEAFELVSLPVGAARYPEPGTAAVAAAGAHALVVPAGMAGAWTLLPAVVLGLAGGALAGASVHQTRFLMSRLVGDDPLDDLASAGALARRHLLGIGMDFVRAALVTLVLAGAGAVLLRWAALNGRGDVVLSVTAIAVATAGMLGASLSIFGGWLERRGAFFFGVVLGCGWLLLT